MRTLGNIIWVVFGGFELALAYFAASIPLFISIIGIPFGVQVVKLGVLCIWPFGAEIRKKQDNSGCLYTFMNILWFFVGGLVTALAHCVLGLIFFITLIGIPFGRQHFKLAGLAISPFGREVIMG